MTIRHDAMMIGTNRAPLRNLSPRVPPIDPRTARPPIKVADRELLTSDHRAWRAAVLNRAGWQCEATDAGQRCLNRHPGHRLFADHIVERKDGGAALDPGNGRCLCGTHHALKTLAERARRMARPTYGEGGVKV